MKKVGVLVCSMLFLPVPTYAVFYKLAILRHKKTGQRIFSLGDTHDDLVGGKATMKQRSDLVAFVKGLMNKGESVHCLVEDTQTASRFDWDSGYESRVMNEVKGDRLLAEKYRDQVTKSMLDCIKLSMPSVPLQLIQCSVLSDLVLYMWTYGISCKNIEKRKIFHDFLVNNNLELDSLEQLVVGASEKEKKGINALYKMMIMQSMRGIQDSSIKKKLLNFLDTYPVLSVESIPHNIPLKMQRQTAFVVDVVAIEDIYKHADVHNIFLCAGWVHNEKIHDFLRSTGDYDEIKTFENERDPNATPFNWYSKQILDLGTMLHEGRRAIEEFEKRLPWWSKMLPRKSPMKSKL